MKLFFSTIFDINYLSRGLSLYNSLNLHHKDFILYIVCLDDQVFDYFIKNNKPSIQLISLAEIEDCYQELLSVKHHRSRVDYIFTLSPFYPSYILKNNPHIPFICTLDCDQYFFSNSNCVFEDLENYSVLLMPHRFSKDLSHLLVYGKYNVSFQVFKNDKVGNNCLSLWRNQCLEWCSDVLEEERFADQKYLNKWHSHFGEYIKEIDHIGIGLAPWNLGDNKISLRNGNVYIQDKILILYHYQGLRFIFKKLVYSGFERYGVKPSSAFVTHVLKPIIKVIAGYQQKSYFDVIERYKSSKAEGLFSHITSIGIYYKFGSFLINLDLLYKIKFMRLHGLFNRFKNLYR